MSKIMDEVPILTTSTSIKIISIGQLGISVDWEPGLETEGPGFKYDLVHFPAVWPWASPLTPLPSPDHSSALEPIHSIDSKMEGEG